MRIMFFGDSNTWGYDPETSLRFTNRYTQLIQSELNDDVIIEERFVKTIPMIQIVTDAWILNAV